MGEVVHREGQFAAVRTAKIVAGVLHASIENEDVDTGIAELLFFTLSANSRTLVSEARSSGMISTPGGTVRPLPRAPVMTRMPG